MTCRLPFELMNRQGPALVSVAVALHRDQHDGGGFLVRRLPPRSRGTIAFHHTNALASYLSFFVFD